MNFFSKLFGGKSEPKGPEELVVSTLKGIFEIGDLKLDFKTKAQGEGQLVVELTGNDSELLRERDGQLLDAIQFFIKRVVQHNFPETRYEVEFDTNGFREESNQALIELAERLRDMALEKGRSVYIRALAPKDRKVIHQFLSSDTRVRSKSVGEGLYKKIKIFPSDSVNNRRDNRQDRPAEEHTASDI